MSDRHGDFTEGKIHQAHNWSYANAAARTGATGFVAADVDKLALQTDTGTYWRLTATTPTWDQVTGTGVGGAVTSVNGNTGAVTLDADDIDDTSTTNKFATAAELTKLAGIEALADVTDAANVDAAGAVMTGDPLTVALNFVIDGGGSAITTGVKGFVRIPFAWTDIAKASLLADASCSAVVDIWKDTLANHPPTDADSITAAAPLTLSAADSVEDATLTGWTQTGSAGDVLAFNVDSNNTAELLTVVLDLVRSL